MGLKDKTVLFTRQWEQAREFIAELEREGAHAIVFPTITITEPDSWEGCDRAIRHIDQYDGLVFTSVNAVQHFLDRCEAVGVGIKDSRRKVYTVGERTKEEVEAHGISVHYSPRDHSGASLIAGMDVGDVKGKRLLVPHGNIGRDEVIDGLRQLGAKVDSVVVYNTKLPKPNGSDDVWGKLVRGEIDVVTFASPSAAVNFAKMFPASRLSEVSSHPRIAVIGPTTAEAVQGLGFAVDIVARESTTSGLVKAIAAYYNGQ